MHSNLRCGRVESILHAKGCIDNHTAEAVSFIVDVRADRALDVLYEFRRMRKQRDARLSVEPNEFAYCSFSHDSGEQGAVQYLGTIDGDHTQDASWQPIKEEEEEEEEEDG